MAYRLVGNKFIEDTSPEFQMYNTLGRDAGATSNNSGDNFFTKRAKSLENALGTTGAYVVGRIDTERENQNIEDRQNRWKQSMDDIYKKYGYENSDAYYDAKNAAEKETFGKYGYDSDNYWNKHAELYSPSGANADALKELENERANIINNMSQEDADKIRKFDSIQNELINQSQANSNEAKKASDDWKNYRENSYVGQKVNQDRGKFAGSAMNTLSTGFDVLSMAAGIPNGALINAGQGAFEGIADELEQNGFNNFDAGRAAQNAITGAAAGAATGALNTKIGNRMAANGGNIINGNNILTKGANSILKSGVGRGALSGAVGGATGAGLSSAMNGVEIGQGIQNTLGGAAQGAVQGGIAGGAMSAANRIGNATLNRFAPELSNSLQENAARNASYGDTMREQFKGAWDSGDSPVAELAKTLPSKANRFIDNINDRGVGMSIKDVGSEQNFNTKAYWEQEMKALDAEGVPFTSPRYQTAMDEWKKAPDLALANTESNTMPQDIQNMRINDNAKGQNTNEFDYIFEDARGNRARLPELRKTLNPDNNTVIANSELIDSPIRGRMYDNMPNSEFIKYAEQNGWKLANTPYEGMSGSEMLNTMAKNAGFEDYNAATRNFTDSGEATKGTDIVDWMENRAKVNTPDTEVYRTLTGDTEPTNTDLMYGESALGNRTRRGMLADSLERFGNTLEGAQTNVTRAAAKDLGIESTGKVVENVRKKTGIVNLETQAALAKELTGGENSLMDSVQRIALSASENGQPYKVDTDPVLRDVESIVDKYADTNMFGSQTAKDRFISNLRRDISNYDSDILSIANRMKSNAADLRGKGVASPAPADAAKAKIYTEIANRLDDLSYKAIPQDNVDAMFDATITEMRGRANQAANNGNNDIAKAYNKLADSLDAEPRTVQAFRSFKKDFVDASKINELTARAENGAAVQMGRSLGGSLRRFGGTLLQRPINTVLAKAGGAVNSLADRVGSEASADTTSKATTTVLPQNQVYNAIGRTTGEIEGEKASGEDGNLTQLSEPLALESMVTNTASSSPNYVYNSIYGNSNNNKNSKSQMYLSLISELVNSGNAGAAASLMDKYYDALSSEAEASTKQTKLTDKQRQANAAERALNDFEGAEHNFAYDVSDIPLIGGIANLGGNEYASKAEALALQIGYMLSGATVNKEEAKNIGMAYVPQPRDNEAVRKAKLQQLRGIIADYQQTYEE